MIIKLAMIIVFFAITVLVGFLVARKASGVDGFVLGGRSVGPWLTAFSFGTSYFSAVIFIGYAGSAHAPRVGQDDQQDAGDQPED